MAFNVAHFLAKQAVTQPTAAAVRAPLSHDRDGTIRYTELSFAELEAEDLANEGTIFEESPRNDSFVHPSVDQELVLKSPILVVAKVEEFVNQTRREKDLSPTKSECRSLATSFSPAQSEQVIGEGQVTGVGFVMYVTS